MNFRTIWKNRIKRSRQKYWEGSDPQPCFDYENIKESNRFLTDNFKDLVLEDFFNILYDFKNNDFEELGNYSIETNNYEAPILYNSTKYGDIEIVAINNVMKQQHYLIIKNHNNIDDISKIYCVSIYKNRGNVENFYDMDSLKKITMKELTNILLNLNLEGETDD